MSTSMRPCTTALAVRRWHLKTKPPTVKRRMALKVQSWMRIEGENRKEDFPSQHDRLLAPDWDVIPFMKPD